jgi:alpha-N-arabinofuranosidase
VRGANIAQMINVLQAMIMTDKEKLVLTPTYYVFKMYLPFQDARFVPVTFSESTYSYNQISLPRVDAIAARDNQGKLWVEITNLDPNEGLEVEASFLGMKANSVSGETLSAPKVDSINTFDSPLTVIPKPISAHMDNGKMLLRLEPKSVTVVSIEK